jgi:signal transduction histidine kinase
MDKLAAIGQMAATVAHKIRNPLGGIQGFTGLLGFDLKDSENGKRLIGKINEGVDKINTIITKFLAYAAPLTLKTRTVNLSKRMQHVVDAMKKYPRAAEKNIQYSIVAPAGEIEADIDMPPRR